MFGDALDGAIAYANLLATDAVVRGLIGPREIPRIWDRHVLNSALVRSAVPPGARVADVGSGAGLPGLPLALSRPDLQVTLIEPLQRRTVFLEQAVVALGLENRVEVVRGRAEDLHGQRWFDIVTARAVAPLPRLVDSSLPLLEAGGALVAIKGSNAQAEADDAGEAVARSGGSRPVVDVIEEFGMTLTVVRVVQQRRSATMGSWSGAGSARSAGSRRGGR
jgi:16S rRNA (guanine527-N7)-methyltransferase